MPKLKTHEQFISEISEINCNIEILGEYKNTNTKIKYRCKSCGYIGESTPHNLLRGVNCYKGAKKSTASKITKSHEDFINEAQQKFPNIIILGKYSKQREPIEAYCTKCDEKFIIIPHDFIKSKYGCPKCALKARVDLSARSNEQFISELHNISPTLEPLSEYKNIHSKVLCKCLECNKEFYAVAGSLLTGHGCQKCSARKMGEKRMMTKEQLINRISLLDKNIELCGEFSSIKNMISVKCLDCNNISEVGIYWLSKKWTCPYCRGSKSIGEQKVENYLKSKNIKFEKQVKFKDLKGTNGGMLSYDFKFLNVLCEVQGEQHQQPIEYFGGEKQFEIQKEHDKRKREYAQNNGFKFLEIWYYDFKNIEKILDDIFEQ